MKRHLTKQRLAIISFPYLLILPAILIMVTVMAYPIFKSLQWSISSVSFLSLDDMHFAGLLNFRNLMQDDRLFQVLGNTFIFTFLSLALSYVIALGTAFFLNTDVPGRSIFRALILLPWVVPPIVAGMIWTTFYDNRIGLFNVILRQFDLPTYRWLGDPKLVLGCLMAVIIWKYTSFMVVALLAGLQSIPNELYEAATVDGATGWQQFRFITMPLLIPVTLVVLILNTVWRLNHFDLVWMLTGGGPGFSSHLIGSFSYLYSLGLMNPGMGSALAVMGTIFSIIFVTLAFRTFGRERLK